MFTQLELSVGLSDGINAKTRNTNNSKEGKGNDKEAGEDDDNKRKDPLSLTRMGILRPFSRSLIAGRVQRRLSLSADQYDSWNATRLTRLRLRSYHQQYPLIRRLQTRCVCAVPCNKKKGKGSKSDRKRWRLSISNTEGKTLFFPHILFQAK